MTEANEGPIDLVIAPVDAERHDSVGAPAAVLPVDDLRIDADTATLPVVRDGTPESMPRRRRGFPWKVLLGLMVIGALVALGVLATQLFQRPTYPVPELVGVPEAEARNMIAANDWVIDVQRERSDEVPVIGQVVRTAPGAGVELAENEPFLIVVSDGPLLRELPESTGVLLSEATTEILARQLQVETVEQYDEVVPPGTVISWSVPGDPTLAAGSEVEPGTLVQLVSSLGPAPRVVPNLIGLTVADATALLAQQQLTLVESEQVFSDDFPLGAIVAQNLVEGTEVPRGGQVAVAISRGPDLIVFPDLSGVANYEQAAAILVRRRASSRCSRSATPWARSRASRIDGEPPTHGQPVPPRRDRRVHSALSRPSAAGAGRSAAATIVAGVTD